jgi:hypothetical protein
MLFDRHLLHLAACRSAWVGASGNNTLHNPAAPNTTGLAAQPAAAPQSQQRQQLSPAAAQRQNVPQPETTLRWLDGEAVDAVLLRRLVALPSVWSAHDVIWSIQVESLICSSRRGRAGPDVESNVDRLLVLRICQMVWSLLTLCCARSDLHASTACKCC